jgi:signal transduction histidine kinase
MLRRLFKLNRLQRKVLIVILTIVVVPMLVAGAFAAAWVSSYFEKRLEQWIVEAARVDQTWLKAYQNDAVMLGGVLSDEREFVARLDRGESVSIDPPLRRIAQELGITFIQVYTPQQSLIFSTHKAGQSSWEPGQTHAVLKVVEKNKSQLAAVGITPIPRSGTPRYYLVLGSLINQDFADELSQLTGLTTRLYYREGKNYLDAFSNPTRVVSLTHLPKDILKRLQQEKKPYYNLKAENGRFRGLYAPIIDSQGRVEAIMFSGLERRGFEEILTNRGVMFLAISLLGIALGGLMGLLLSRFVVRPIEHLRNGVMQLAGQNFNAIVPITSDDELGDLAKAFNAMAIRLREARDEQQQRFQKDKLSALGEVSAALAHEIRNPIGVINTASALLDKPEQTPEKRSELLRMIREESMRVSHLVQDFLQLSRHRQPAFSEIDPVTPMERALATTLAGKNNLRVIKRLEHGQAHIQADAGLLQQAWTNLFTNALEAMGPQEGQLTLESAAARDQVMLSVEDSGPGIDATVMPRLFEPFFTTKEQGTGLGLSIAHALVEANGGALEALVPVKKSGAKFVMRFPVYAKAGV